MVMITRREAIRISSFAVAAPLMGALMPTQAFGQADLTQGGTPNLTLNGDLCNYILTAGASVTKAARNGELTSDHCKRVSSLMHLFANHVAQTDWDKIITALVSTLSTSSVMTATTAMAENMLSEYRKYDPDANFSTEAQSLSPSEAADLHSSLESGGVSTFFHGLGDIFARGSWQVTASEANLISAPIYRPKINLKQRNVHPHLQHASFDVKPHLQYVGVGAACKAQVCSAQAENGVVSAGIVAGLFALACNPWGLAAITAAIPPYGVALDATCAAVVLNPAAFYLAAGGLATAVLGAYQYLFC